MGALCELIYSSRGIKTVYPNHNLFVREDAIIYTFYIKTLFKYIAFFNKNSKLVLI